jgi:Plavaka transposase
MSRYHRCPVCKQGQYLDLTDMQEHLLLNPRCNQRYPRAVLRQPREGQTLAGSHDSTQSIVATSHTEEGGTGVPQVVVLNYRNNQSGKTANNSIDNTSDVESQASGPLFDLPVPQMKPSYETVPEMDLSLPSGEADPSTALCHLSPSPLWQHDDEQQNPIQTTHRYNTRSKSMIAAPPPTSTASLSLNSHQSSSCQTASEATPYSTKEDDISLLDNSTDHMLLDSSPLVAAQARNITINLHNPVNPYLGTEVHFCTKPQECYMQLADIVCHHRLPLFTFDILMMWAVEAARSGALDGSIQHPRRKTYWHNIIRDFSSTKVMRIPVLLENERTRPFMDGTYNLEAYHRGEDDLIEIPTFSFEGQLRDLLLDDQLFCDPGNLVINEDPVDKSTRFTPYRIKDGEMLDDIHSANWYQGLAEEANNHFLDFNPDFDFIIGVIIFIDKTHTDCYGRHNLEPIIFTLTILRQHIRDNPRGWRVLGYIPDLETKSKAEVSLRRGQTSTSTNIRNVHRCLNAVLQSLQHAQTNPPILELNLGGVTKLVRLRLPVCCFLGDAKSNDGLCGRYFSHKTQRISRTCFATYEESNRPNLRCSHVTASAILPLTEFVMLHHEPPLQSNELGIYSLDVLKDKSKRNAIDCLWHHHPFMALQLANDSRRTHNISEEVVLQVCQLVLKYKSQHEAHGLIFDLDYGVEEGSIFTAATTDPMHAFLLGVLKYAMELILDEYTPTGRAEIDISIRRRHSSGQLRQSDLKRFPRANLIKGITNLTKVTAEEVDGVAFQLLLFLITGKGRSFAVKQYSRARPGRECISGHEALLRYGRIVFLLESFLSFHAWTKYGPFGLAGRSEGAVMAKHIIDCRIRQMLEDLTIICPREKYCRDSGQIQPVGNGWHIQKLHELTHLAEVVQRTGSLANINASQGESHLKSYAKAPAATSQKTSPKTFLEQAVMRVEFSNALDRCFRLRGVNRLRPTNPHSKLQSHPDTAIEGEDDAAAGDTKTERHRFGGCLFELEISRAGGTSRQPAQFEYTVVYKNPRLKEERALDPHVREWLTAHFAAECRLEDYDGAVVVGFSQCKRGDFFVRSHPHFMGNSWYDWIMADYRTDDEVEGVHNQDRRAQYAHLFGSTEELALCNTAADGCLTWYKRLVPAKVLAMITYTYNRGANSQQQRENGFVLHCAHERDAPESIHLRTTLLSQQWKMEYHSDGNPKLRLVGLDSVAGSVLVAEDSCEKNPFLTRPQSGPGPACEAPARSKRQRTNTDTDVYVYSVFDRQDAWPRQFLASTELPPDVPNNLV